MFSVYTEVSFSAFTYVYGWPVLITHSWGAAFKVSKKSYNTSELQQYITSVLYLYVIEAPSITFVKKCIP